MQRKGRSRAQKSDLCKKTDFQEKKMCAITDENSRARRKTDPLQACKAWDFHHGREDRRGRKQNSTRTETSMKD